MAFRIHLALCLLLWTGSEAQKQEGTGSPCYKTDDYGNQDLEQPQVIEIKFRLKKYWAAFRELKEKKMSPSIPIDFREEKSVQVAARCGTRT